MSYDICTDFLTTEESDRLAESYPHLKDVTPYDYCPTCSKTGTYKWRGEDHECPCTLQLQLLKHYCNSGIGSTYQRLDWDDWEGDQELRHLMQVYVEDPRFIEEGEGLFLWGNPGTGKTMLANLILKDLVKRGVRCYATTFSGMIDEFTKGWSDASEKRWFERKFKLTDVLLLDDLGREVRGRANLPQTTFDNLLRTRVQAGRPTLITTNMRPEEIDTGYGSGVLNLLWEQSLAYHMTGDNWHRKIPERRSAERASGERRPIV